jgi:hypothetical protein
METEGVNQEDPFLDTEALKPVRPGPLVKAAMFKSTCSDCGWWIQEGDPITPDGDGGWMCAEHGA